MIAEIQNVNSMRTPCIDSITLVISEFDKIPGLAEAWQNTSGYSYISYQQDKICRRGWASYKFYGLHDSWLTINQ